MVWVWGHSLCMKIRRQLCKLVLSSHLHMNSCDQAQAVRLYSKQLYPLSDLLGLNIFSTSDSARRELPQGRLEFFLSVLSQLPPQDKLGNQLRDAGVVGRPRRKGKPQSSTANFFYYLTSKDCVSSAGQSESVAKQQSSGGSARLSSNQLPDCKSSWPINGQFQWGRPMTSAFRMMPSNPQCTRTPQVWRVFPAPQDLDRSFSLAPVHHEPFSLTVRYKNI